MFGLLPDNIPVELWPVGSSILYAFTLVILRRAMQGGTPTAALLTVNTVVAIGGLAAALVRGTLFTTALEPLLWFVVIGFFGQGIGTITHYIGIERMGVSRSTPIQSATPIWGVLLAVLILGESPSAVTMMGTVGIVGGVMLLAFPEKSAAETFRGWLRGAVIFPLTSSVVYAIVPVFAKLAYAEQGTPILGFGVAFATGSLTMLAGKRFIPGGGRIRAERWSFWLFVLAGVLNLLGAFLYWSALVIGDVSVILPISRLYPLFVVILSALFLGKLERITLRLVLAAAFIVAGGIAVTMFQ
jgi:drug/metabolite transporter (DMT)-like permease